MSKSNIFEESAAAEAITYAEMTVDAANPLVRFAHRSRMARSLQAFKDAVAVSSTHEGMTCVDFGAGTGLLLHQLRSEFPGADLIGVEPYMEPLYPHSARYVGSLDVLHAQSIDVISAFEVCEHLYENELDQFLNGCQRVLRPEGRLIISVPIMFGATLALKEFNHVRLHGKTDYSLAEIFRSTLGLSVPRPPDPRGTHKGFDFRWFLRIAGGMLRIESRSYSPFPALPWFLNSQIFFVCSLKTCYAAADANCAPE